MKGADAIAIKVYGYWSADRNLGGRIPSREKSNKWIIFTSDYPLIGNYVDLSSMSFMLTPDGKEGLTEYRKAETDYKNKILKALNIYDDSEVALWEVNTHDDGIPKALHTVVDKYYNEISLNYNSRGHAFVIASADEKSFMNICFVIEDLMEIRATILKPDDSFILLCKNPSKNITRKNGEVE